MANYRLGIFCGAPGPWKGSFEGSSRGRGWGDTNNPFTHIVCGKRSEKKESFDFFTMYEFEQTDLLPYLAPFF